MSVNLQAMGIDQLSVVERLELIEEIWNSLPEQIAPENIPAWHLAELAARRAVAESQPGVGRPFRDVLRELESG
jgi:putative addiction module component (TIGR02574 family)